MYKNVLKKLYKYNQINPVKLGLSNSLKLYELLGSPLNNVPIVHVGGTNGKGSVCFKTANYLQECGIKTGLFVSPHISSFRERIQVNGNYLSEDDVLEYLPLLFSLCEQNNIPATFFELTTALAWLKFKQSRCEAVVLEVGLGGRLDATNVVTPVISVITSIQMDHMKILGDTLEKIATEKAGIFKPGVFALIGPGSCESVLKSEANRVGAKLFKVDEVLGYKVNEFTTKESENEKDNGDADQLNQHITRAVIKLLKDPTISSCRDINISSVLSRIQSNEDLLVKSLQVRPPCRFEIIQKQIIDAKGTPRDVTVILDIAHNKDAIASLVRKVKKQYPLSDVRIVLGMCADKNISDCLFSLLTLCSVDRIHCTSANHPRAIEKSKLREMLQECDLSRKNNDNNQYANLKVDDQKYSSLDQSIRESIKSALQLSVYESSSLNIPPVVLVCGSTFIMAEIRAELGIIEPKDGDLFDSSDGIARDAQDFFPDKNTRFL